MKKFKYISSMIFLIAFAILFNFSAFAGTWKQDTVGWWYQSDDGSYPKGNWKQVDNTWYYFDTNGYMKTGWIQSGNKWYYCNLNGSLATNCWVGEYYVGADGAMYVNTTTPDGKQVDETGLVKNDTISKVGSIVNIPYKKQIINKTIVCELSGTVVDKGGYYILENQILSGYIEGEGDEPIYSGSIYIVKNAQFNYINMNNEYSTDEGLSIIEYISVGNGEITWLDFDENGYLITGTTRVSS